ncbi:transposase [Blastopirellula retiformator]|uniref:Uncharacterized protein n=1 Tax=Blastopirellula retiformator TaxID=2527970 RepID=A0A5C5V9B2_9BACT|nr:transposase [Blastopirellula retiformator]TWT34312.1 hypothetical protein Enr8_17060 [Blastopirellula retiformator]
MTMDRLRAKAADRLDETHHRFEICFGRPEVRAHSLVYLRGLMLADVKKNAEAIALRFAAKKRCQDSFFLRQHMIPCCHG